MTSSRCSSGSWSVARRSTRRAARCWRRGSSIGSRTRCRLSGRRPAVPSDQLFELYTDERQARASGAVVGRETGAARERHAIVASGAPRWSSFAKRLDRAQRNGLKSLGEDGVRDFVAEYRDLAADLARLQTAARGRERDEVFYLSRLMAGAHNLLYRGRALTFTDVWRTFAVDAPREVRRVGPVALAAAVDVRSGDHCLHGRRPRPGGGAGVHPARRCWIGPRMALGGRRRGGGTFRIRSCSVP